MQNHSNPVRLGSLALAVLIAMSTQVSAQEATEAPDCYDCEAVIEVGVSSEEFEGMVVDGDLEAYPSLTPELTPFEGDFEVTGLDIYPSMAAEPEVYDDSVDFVLTTAGAAPTQAVFIPSERDGDQMAPTAIEGNLCLNKATYVSLLCAWQGFERP